MKSAAALAAAEQRIATLEVRLHACMCHGTLAIVLLDISVFAPILIVQGLVCAHIPTLAECAALLSCRINCLGYSLLVPPSQCLRVCPPPTGCHFCMYVCVYLSALFLPNDTTMQASLQQSSSTAVALTARVATAISDADVQVCVCVCVCDLMDGSVLERIPVNTEYMLKTLIGVAHILCAHC